jgi:hypothetical protein
MKAQASHASLEMLAQVRNSFSDAPSRRRLVDCRFVNFLDDDHASPVDTFRPVDRSSRPF